MSETAVDSTYELLGKIVRALDDKKAGNLRVLDVRGNSTITDFLVIGTGTSDPHLRAMRIETEKILDAERAPIAGMDLGNYGSGWLVVDAYQIMVHFFTAAKRDEFKLEKLWQDSREIKISEFVAPPPAAVKVAKPKAVKKSAPKKAKKVAKKPVKKAAKKVAAKKKPVARKKPAAKKKR